MLFHRRQHTQITLNTSRVVIANILLDHLNKLVLAGEPSAVISILEPASLGNDLNEITVTVGGYDCGKAYIKRH